MMPSLIDVKAINNTRYTLWQKSDYNYEIDISKQGLRTTIEFAEKPFEYAKGVFDTLGSEVDVYA